MEMTDLVLFFNLFIAFEMTVLDRVARPTTLEQNAAHLHVLYVRMLVLYL